MIWKLTEGREVIDLFFLLGHLNQVLKVVQDFDKEGRKGAATERVLLT